MKMLLGPPPFLNNRYQLVQQLGRGGMGLVYRAIDQMLNRDVAIKFLSPDRMVDRAVQERFYREARTIAQLSHTHIMMLYDVGQEAEWHYLILEYLAGKNLHQTVADENGRLPIPTALTIFTQLLQALAYAHDKGVIHRDIKPENVMVLPDGRIKLTDFGLALLHDEVRLTLDGVLMGTAIYLAPECITGSPANIQSDLYACGTLFYELVTGRPPFVGTNPALVLADVLNTNVPPPSLLNDAVFPELEALLLKLLEKNPADRFPSAHAVLAALPSHTMGSLPSKPLAQPLLRQTLLERLVRSSSSLEIVKPPDGVEVDEAAALMSELLMVAALEDTAVAVEVERRRLAQLLHDNLIEPLNLLLAQIQSYEQSLAANPTTRMAMSILSSLTRQTVQQAADLETQLHPTILENLGLEPALESLANQMMRAKGIQISLQLQRLPQRLPQPIELALYRVSQDVLQDATTLAKATRASINLSAEKSQLLFSYNDNGIQQTGMTHLKQARQRIEQLGGRLIVTAVPHNFTCDIQFDLSPPVHLTPREMDVIKLISEGLSNKEIAQNLSVTPRTVNFHLDNIYSKLGVNSRTEAAVYALRQGWVQINPG
jgi:serine/threonine protein kinase/DNA-binding NarL/FixJ family response regulator